MAGVEDFADFGSHFLDSMLEVEMTEEDGEVKISQPDDPSTSNDGDLPPIPRFDLQSETMTYKEVYRNSVIPTKQTSILRTVPAQLPGTTIVPVLQSAPMIVIPTNLLKGSNVPLKTNTVGNTVQTVIAKPSPVLKALLTKTGAMQESADEIIKQIFKPEYVKKVFKKQEEPHDVSQFGEEEETFYKSAFEDVSKVQLCKLHCTICDKHLGCAKDVEKKINVHSMLKVLTCKICHEFYGDGNFPCDDGDHCEIYCRWCGQGGALICCSFCPKVFCKRCVRRNFARSYLRAIERASDWACFVCAQKPLWPHRAVCRALLEFVRQKKSDSKSAKDTSICCKSQLVSKRIISEVDRNKIFLSGGQTIQISANGKEQGTTTTTTTTIASTTGTEVKGKVVTPIAKISGNGHLIVKNFPAAFKLNDQNKTPLTVIAKAQNLTVTPKIVSSSVIKNNISKTVNSVPPLTSISGLTIPPIINTPIYHGQTLITPPGAKQNSVQKKPLNIPSKEQSPCVKVSVTDCVNVDINKIPVAKIPHNLQGVILRLNFPDNKVQLVRLLTEDKGADGNTNFPMPTFENSENLDFLEGSLEDSFKLTKMLYERLMKIKEKLNSKTKHTKDSVYKSSVRKLSFIYEKARELMKELDDNLVSNYENWKSEREQEKEVIVLDVSDDEAAASPAKPVPNLPERSSSIFAKKTKIFAQDDDSDIEVIVAATGNLPGQRSLRSSAKRNSQIPAPAPSTPVRRSKASPGQASTQTSPATQKTPESHKATQSTPSKRRKVSRRSRKRAKVSEEEVVEKDPLAVSDGEEVNGEGVEQPTGFLTSIIEIKQENLNDFN